MRLVGGGSISVDIAGGGSDEMASSPEEVSTVICFVVAFIERELYRTGEHFTATEGFLCPGR